MRRILIATDGSDAAREAIEVGVALAQHEDAEAIFVHAVPLIQLVSINGFGLTGHVPYEPTPRDEGVLDDAMAVAKCEGVPAAAALLRGDTAMEIVAYADSIDADLIVVG